MSLEWIIPNQIGYYRGPATVGLIKGATGWILIDTGVEAAVPKKIIKALREAFNEPLLKVSGVVNTHAHADHCGGNRWLQNQFDMPIFASEGEQPYIAYPFLEPHYLFSAEAPKALKGKFFQAEASQVNQVIRFDSSLEKRQAGDQAAIVVDGVELTAVALPGHSKDMIGIITAEGICFCGDLLFTPIILEKHPLLFEHDYEQYLNALSWMATQSFKGYVLTHGGYFEEASSLVVAAKSRLEQNMVIICALISRMQYDNPAAKGVNETTLHAGLAEQLALEEDFGAWHLNHGVLRSYLAYALKENRVQWEKGLYLCQ